MMNIKEIAEQIDWVMSEVEDTPDKYRQLHELGWQLINASRPENFYDDKEQEMKGLLAGMGGVVIEEDKSNNDKLISLRDLEKVIADIKSNDNWVNDSHTHAEHRGMCNGFDELIRHFDA